MAGMNPLEKKAALKLRPYMGKDPVIFDVGSNKGEWSEYLGPSCAEVHLFEPNEVLLHYTMVKFDDLTNIVYHSFGLFSESKDLDFYYFTNSNNGLSSVYKNQRWVDAGLPMKHKKIIVRKLDDIWSKEIDFLKIDVEGADLEVLKGADKLLTQKKIKFIQVEHSEHIHLSGKTWEDLVEYVRGKGYDVYDFDGEKFFKPEKWEGENYYIMAEITQNWNSEFIKNTEFLKKRLDFVLEIGCFEGLTTRYICDELLAPGGRMIAIDPLTDEYLTTDAHKSAVDPDSQSTNKECEGMFTGQYERFFRNTKGYPVELIRKTSREAMTGDFKHYRFDLIYVDGDHRSEEVFNDGVLSFEVCRKGGYILFDDYGWRENTAQGIERFLNEYKNYIEVILKDYQVLVKKIYNIEDF